MKPRERPNFWSIFVVVLFIGAGFLYYWLEKRLGLDSDDSYYDSRPLDWRRFE